MRFLRSLRHSIERLGPYPSLYLLAVPFIVIELLKLAAVLILGGGHWLAGTIAMICAYAVSLLVIERLFSIVKPKLLTLPWFAAIWRWYVAARRNVVGWLRTKWALGLRGS